MKIKLIKEINYLYKLYIDNNFKDFYKQKIELS